MNKTVDWVEFRRKVLRLDPQGLQKFITQITDNSFNAGIETGRQMEQQEQAMLRSIGILGRSN